MAADVTHNARILPHCIVVKYLPRKIVVRMTTSQPVVLHNIRLFVDSVLDIFIINLIYQSIKMVDNDKLLYASNHP